MAKLAFPKGRAVDRLSLRKPSLLFCLGGTLLGVVHIVDDDASFATATELRLKRAGCEAMIYASAQHLLDHLPSESVPSCILSTCGHQA
jgi:hypothetical protein